MMFEEILRKTSINPKYYDKAQIYLKKYANRKADPSVISQMVNSLRVLSGIDLSRVHFIDNKQICKHHEATISITREQMEELKLQGVDVESMYSYKLLDEISSVINKIIEKDGGIIINEICETMKQETINNFVKISFTFYILSWDSYRGFKIKKLKSIINHNYD